MDSGLIQLDQGSGGRAMHELIDSLFVSAFENPLLAERNDSAVFEIQGWRLAMTTDSYVETLFFSLEATLGALPCTVQ